MIVVRQVFDLERPAASMVQVKTEAVQVKTEAESEADAKGKKEARK